VGRWNERCCLLYSSYVTGCARYRFHKDTEMSRYHEVSKLRYESFDKRKMSMSQEDVRDQKGGRPVSHPLFSFHSLRVKGFLGAV
jgi:hypothetical protein